MNVRNNLGELLLGTDVVLDPSVIHQVDGRHCRVGAGERHDTSVVSGSECENVDRGRG